MKIILLLYILFMNCSVYSGSQDTAIKKTAEALSKTETGKEITKNIEKTVNNALPLDKGTVALLGSVAVTASQGKIDTKIIKNMDIEILHGDIRPDAEYDFKDNNSSFMLKYRLIF